MDFINIRCWMYQVTVVFVAATYMFGGKSQFEVECASPQRTEQSPIVFPYDVSSTNDLKYLQFKIRDSNDDVLQFQLQAKEDILNNNTHSCVMEGSVVYKRKSYYIKLAVCDGLTGIICKDGGEKTLFLKPLLEVGAVVSLEMLSRQAHMLTLYDADDVVPEMFDELHPHEIVPEIDEPTRNRRDITKIPHAVLNLFNKAHTNVYMYYMQPQTSERQYFSELRKNEKNMLRSSVGTTWLAYDENQQPLLLNKKFNLLVYPQYTGENLDVIITSKSKTPSKDRIMRDLPKLKPKYLEVLVVGDSSFVKKQGSKEIAERYIKAIIKMVNILFRHKSLDVTFHVILNKIILLDKKDDVFITESQPRNSLSNACKFMHNEKEKKNLKFDFGIFFTRRKFGFSGFTPLYRMCFPRKSCTLIFDSGMKSAFVVAHEIGHSIGISHDGDHNDCIQDTGRGSIMAPTIYSVFGNYHWSNCSKLQIHENLNYFPCLTNKPKEVIVNLTDLPGNTFDIDDQCRRYWGKGYKSCFGIRDPQQYCAYTFCRVPNTKVSQCSYHTSPPVDGTKCDKDKWCVNRKCVPFGRLIPVAVDGLWSHWESWTSCSGRCGQGVRFRNRRCDNPRPIFGGKECNGTSREWELCQRRRCSVVHTFADQRYDACYQTYGKGWQWFSDADNQRKVEDLNLNCTFEDGFKEWRNSEETEVKWKLGKGETLTPKTGPNFDHTLRNENGTYLYFESSYPTRNGDTAMLISPKILVPALCLNFYAHMYGERVGILRVLRLVEGDDSVELWSLKGSQGGGWIKVGVNISYVKEYQIGIEVERDKTYLSDIAIDDIVITPGLCRKDPETMDCNLTCFNNETREFKVHKPVPHGMKCVKHRTDICVDARCQRVGCDDVIGSQLQYDVCGVCGGDNGTCSSQKFMVDITPNQLTENVILVSTGFYRFTAEKLTSSKARLALRDVSRRATHYYDYSTSQTYKWNYFPIRNTTFRYYALENETERVFIDGVVNTDMELQLIFPGPKLNKSEVIRIEYSVYVPLNTTEEIFSWKLIRWTPCTAACGGGTSTAVNKCINLRKNAVSDPAKCSPTNVEILEQTKSCNTHICNVKYVYDIGKWKKCPVCGRIGVRSRTVTCIRMKEGETPVTVDSKHCLSNHKPIDKMKCFRYCPRRKPRCVERSNLCAGLVRKGYCKYDNVKTLCCESCKTPSLST